ncbi:deoxyribonuclease IV, partial [Lecanoromycetidae sp. Uapishka_2]
MFLKSQRKWENPPLLDEQRDLFIASCGDHKYDAASHVLPHGSYLVNLAQDEPEKASRAYNAFLDDLHRCEALGIRLYNFHPGSTGNQPRPSAIARIADALNHANKATKNVVPVLETMANGGNVIGSTFEDLRNIIAHVHDKTRIGVCLDTCHVFAAGYDLRSPSSFKETLQRFDEVVGLQYLRAIHLNDSKAPFGSHRDLHQNIGLGFLGLRAFHNVMNEPRFEGLPIVLETPIDHKDPESGKDIEDKGVWAREIKMLEGLIGFDAESDEFKAMETDLADKGAEERKKLQDVYDKKVEKDKKKLERGQQKLVFAAKKRQEKTDDGSKAEV